MDNMDPKEIERALVDLDGWQRDGNAIGKSFSFDTFPAAIRFIDRIAVEAEDAGHHPELRNVYTTVEVRLTTHDAGGVTQKDLDLAERIDSVA